MGVDGAQEGDEEVFSGHIHGGAYLVRRLHRTGAAHHPDLRALAASMKGTPFPGSQTTVLGAHPQ